MGLGSFVRSAYCEVAGELAGAEAGVEAEDDGEAGVTTGFGAAEAGAVDEELAKMLGAAALCEVLAPRFRPVELEAPPTVALPSGDGR